MRDPALASYRFAVLGDPIEHSRSPQLHTAMLQLAGLEGEYHRVRADEDILASTVEGLRTGEWDGLNVTMPLKGAAYRLSDSLSVAADRAGSVNTLSRVDSKIAGDSTDSSAFRHLLGSDRFAERSSVLVLGAGGSAAAAIAAMDPSAKVYVTARREGPARDLTSRLDGQVVSWGTAVARALVVNTTPLGMGGESLPEGILGVAVGLIDLPYGHERTPAIGEAERCGLPYADGHEFLLRQAMASFELWTGVALDYKMVSEAISRLPENT